MKLSNIHIKNYKALRDVSIPLSNFVCLTGENNAGKSSILQALSLFLSPTKLDGHHFFDPAKEISVTVKFSEITDADLARFNEEPREKIRAWVKDGVLELTRQFKLEGEPAIGKFALLPKDKNFSKDSVDNALMGKKSKADLKGAIVSLFPGKESEIPDGISTQKAAKELIEKWGDALPDSDKVLQFKPIPTGAGFSITPLFPDDIYIPAVKDLKDDVSAKQGSSFAKILGILMGQIEAKLADEADLFEKLRAKLTRVRKEGSVEDTRLLEIKEIESTIEGYVRESFSNVSLELDIPPPELKTILSTARIFVDDGSAGPLEFKGDGLRRAVVFAILRTYVKLVAKKKPDVEGVPADGAVKPSERGYILLFEEPELFLHPDAQKILFEALRVFAKDHHVICTTHSPIFLGVGAATFVRLSKGKEKDVPKPFTLATPVDLKDMHPKDEFQLICFENNNAALFAKKVVLVEGDSEMIVFPHIASMLDPEWSCAKHSVAFVQARGKGSIQRYRSFFKRFNVPTYVVVDLDAVDEHFEKLDPTDEHTKMRNELLVLVDKAIPAERSEPSGKDVKKAQEKGALKAKWARAREAKAQFDADPAKFSELQISVQEFFDWEKKSDRLEAMQNPPNKEIADALGKLISAMRGSGVHILSKGVIEDYYPDGITGRDKPSKAQNYRNTVSKREHVLAKCRSVSTAEGTDAPELEIICKSIFM